MATRSKADLATTLVGVASRRRGRAHRPVPGYPPMSQAPPALDPWRLVWGQPYIDSRTLAAAIEQDLTLNDRPDFRTRLLVRDAAVALRSYWGQPRFSQWLAASTAGPLVREIMDEDLGEPGYTT